MVGEAGDLVRILGGGDELSESVILMCHGNERGLTLPELHSSIEKNQPFHGALTPSDLRQFLKLPGALVLNTGCSLGTPAFAEAFLKAGCRTYIGPIDDPDGDACVFYTLQFFYELICRACSPKRAHEMAAAHDDQTRMFRLYSGRCRVAAAER